MPESLLLKKNDAAQWVVDRMKAQSWKKTPNVGEASLFQYLPGYHACMTVRESGQVHSEAGKYAAAVRNYRDFAAMASLKWLELEFDFTSRHRPVWLTQDIMGRNAMGDKIMADAKRTGTPGKLYTESEGSLWRTRFNDVAAVIRGEWNQAYDKLCQDDGTLNSGQQMDDVMESLHEAMWKLEPKSRKTLKRKKKNATPAGEGAVGDGVAGGGAAGGSAAGGGAAGEVAAAVTPGEAETIEISVEMPANWISKVSLIFALLGRPAGVANQHHVLALEDSSGPDLAGGGSGEDDGGGSGGSSGSALKSANSIKNLKKKGVKGAGIPSSRSEKRKEGEDDKRQAKREKVRQEATASGDRILHLLENPVESEADVVITKYIEELREGARRNEVRERTADMQATRDAEVKTLKDKIQLLEDMGMTSKARACKLTLLELFESPLPKPEMLVVKTPSPPRETINADDSAATAGASQTTSEIDLTDESAAAGESSSTEKAGDRSVPRLGVGEGGENGVREDEDDDEEGNPLFDAECFEVVGGELSEEEESDGFEMPPTFKSVGSSAADPNAAVLAREALVRTGPGVQIHAGVPPPTTAGTGPGVPIHGRVSPPTTAGTGPGVHTHDGVSPPTTAGAPVAMMSGGGGVPVASLQPSGHNGLLRSSSPTVHAAQTAPCPGTHWSSAGGLEQQNASTVSSGAAAAAHSASVVQAAHAAHAAHAAYAAHLQAAQVAHAAGAGQAAASTTAGEALAPPPLRAAMPGFNAHRSLALMEPLQEGASPVLAGGRAPYDGATAVAVRSAVPMAATSVAEVLAAAEARAAAASGAAGARAKA